MSVMYVPARLLRDESGFIVSTELVLIATVVVLGMVAGLTCVRNAVVGELTDVGDSFGALNQSYCYSGFSARKSFDCGNKSTSAGSVFVDLDDLSDAERAALNAAADLEGADSSGGKAAASAAASADASADAAAAAPAVAPAVVPAPAPPTTAPAVAPAAPAIPIGVPCPPESIPGSALPGAPSFGPGPGACPPGTTIAPGMHPIPEGVIPAPGTGPSAAGMGMMQGTYDSAGASGSVIISGSLPPGAVITSPGPVNGSLLAPPTGAVIYRGMAAPPGSGYGNGGYGNGGYGNGGYSGYRYGSGRGFGGYSGGFNGTYGNGAPFNCLDCGY